MIILKKIQLFNILSSINYFYISDNYFFLIYLKKIPFLNKNIYIHHKNKIIFFNSYTSTIYIIIILIQTLCIFDWYIKSIISTYKKCF